MLLSLSLSLKTGIMQRRTFLRNTSITALMLPWALEACTSKKTEEAAGIAPEVNLDEFTVVDLQEKMQSGELTSKAITEFYLKKIDQIDKHGPTINAVIELNPDALSIAAQLDLERSGNKVRGPLHGIPVLIKDNINTGDQMFTTAGSIALEGNRSAKDAFIISKLRESGAVLLGKTNLSEWANFRSTRSSSGWSSRGGQTKNPYALERNPCGSSSGSGAAVSANLCAIAIGTETNGSIICPASINGVVGIKPTVGVWSRSGIIPISITQDTAGPMARTVADAALLLGALTGTDDDDAATKRSEGRIEKDYTKFLDADGLKGKRIGIEKSYLKSHEAVDALLHNAIEQMKSKGAEIVEVDFLKLLDGIRMDEFLVLQYEFKDGLNTYLKTANGKVKSLKELIEFNKANEAKAMPYFKQEILESSEAKGGLDAKEYKSALSHILDITQSAVTNLMTKEKLDAISGPSFGPSWCTDWINGDYGTGYGFTDAAAIAGYPHISVPMGFVFDLPIGLSFFGKAYTEGELIKIAYAYEQVSKNRKQPVFKITSGIDNKV
jgi:amidase